MTAGELGCHAVSGLISGLAPARKGDPQNDL
jgi:hypothetical protein